MATIKDNFAEGGANLGLQGAHGEPDLATVLQELADDVELFRGNLNSLHAKLDADAGVTDVDYASTLDIAAGDVKHKRG
jgi:hypothetical protein